MAGQLSYARITTPPTVQTSKTTFVQSITYKRAHGIDPHWHPAQSPDLNVMEVRSIAKRTLVFVREAEKCGVFRVLNDTNFDQGVEQSSMICSVWCYYTTTLCLAEMPNQVQRKS